MCTHNSCTTFKTAPSIGTSDHIRIQWTHYPFVFFLKFCSNDFLAFSSSLSYLLSLSFLLSPAPLKVVLAPESHYWLAFPWCFFFFLYLLCHLTISSGFIAAINVGLSLSRSLLPAPAFSLPRLLKPYLSKTSQVSHLLVSQMQLSKLVSQHSLQSTDTSFQFSFLPSIFLP